MKRINILVVSLLLFLFTNCAITPEDIVPDAVQKAFQKKYPAEKDPHWQLDKNGFWEASFKKDGVKHRADFSMSGKWIETEVNIEEKDLPEMIKRQIKAKFDGYKVSEIEKVDHHSKGTFYDVEFGWGGQKVDVEFTVF